MESSNLQVFSCMLPRQADSVPKPNLPEESAVFVFIVHLRIILDKYRILVNLYYLILLACYNKISHGEDYTFKLCLKNPNETLTIVTNAERM